MQTIVGKIKDTASIITVALPRLNLHCILRDPMSIQMSYNTNDREFFYIVGYQSLMKKSVNFL